MGDFGFNGIGGGAYMWREVWDEEVSKIYSEVLSKCFHGLFDMY